jgi:hypothetical protein
MIIIAMTEETLTQALRNKLKEKDMDIPETVHYNAGIIDAIEEVQRQYALEKVKNSH